jgi:hypothetical protein
VRSVGHFSAGHFWQRFEFSIRDAAALMAASARDKTASGPAPSCGAVDRTSNWLRKNPPIPPASSETPSARVQLQVRIAQRPGSPLLAAPSSQHLSWHPSVQLADQSRRSGQRVIERRPVSATATRFNAARTDAACAVAVASCSSWAAFAGRGQIRLSLRCHRHYVFLLGGRFRSKLVKFTLIGSKCCVGVPSASGLSQPLPNGRQNRNLRAQTVGQFIKLRGCLIGQLKTARPRLLIRAGMFAISFQSATI